MRKLLFALAAAGVLGAGCAWVPVKISAPSDNTVYVLDRRIPAFFAAEGRVIRCNGTHCVKVYQPE